MTPPIRVTEAELCAARAGFGLSCDAHAGRLLAVLAAAVPTDGRVLELGTGVGVGLAWLVSGLGERTDVEVHSVEMDPIAAAMAASADWPSWVTLHTGDALELLPGLGCFDLIFADAQGGKTHGLSLTLGALAPGGQLLVDDMYAQPDNPMHRDLWPALQAVRERILADPALVATELSYGTGMILATRRSGTERTDPG
jgi:demethylmenaquinone methyltransferase/2-methoxy-6-polyprenyl-1,4-benzoquinol methylase